MVVVVRARPIPRRERRPGRRRARDGFAARRVAELESALAERDAEAAAAREAREDLLAEHAAFEADVADIRRDAETARRAAAESSERARISAERERAALDAVGGESARADAAEAEMATLTKQADIMAAQLEVASLRLDVLVREQREEDVARTTPRRGRTTPRQGRTAPRRARATRRNLPRTPRFVATVSPRVCNAWSATTRAWFARRRLSSPRVAIWRSV